MGIRKRGYVCSLDLLPFHNEPRIIIASYIGKSKKDCDKWALNLHKSLKNSQLITNLTLRYWEVTDTCEVENALYFDFIADKTRPIHPDKLWGFQ